MRFVTVTDARSGTERYVRQTGGRGHYFRLEYDVRHDPTVEGLSLQFGAHLGDSFDPYYWPAVANGTAGGFGALHGNGVRLCCVRFVLTHGHNHEVGGAYQSVEIGTSWFVREVLSTWLTPIEPLRAEWLTHDVVALARGIRAQEALDGIPALTDALLEAGCDHPLALEHLRTCPNHATMCWAVEMILDQAAARDGTASG